MLIVYGAIGRAFAFYFLFLRDENYHFCSISKTMKMREQIFKKNNSNRTEIIGTVKKNEKGSNSPIYRFAAKNKNKQK